MVSMFKAQDPRRRCDADGLEKLKMRNMLSVTFKIPDQLVSHDKIWDATAFMGMKQTLGSLVSGVLQELNVTFLFVPESPGNSVQQIRSAPYARPVSVTVPCV